MSLADELRAIGDLVFEEALPRQVEILQGSTPSAPIVKDHGQSGSFSFVMGQDVNGNSWLYAYTSDERLVEAGLGDEERAEFRFEDLVKIAFDNHLGGLVIDNHDVEAVVHIPGYCMESLNSHLNG